MEARQRFIFDGRRGKGEKRRYSPSQKDMPNSTALKRRFGIWKNVLTVAGLPILNDPDCMRKRQDAIEWGKRVGNPK